MRLFIGVICMIKKINYEYINNNKRTLVLLQGWGLDKSVYDRLVHFFCNKYSVLAVDFPGFGESETPSDYYDTYEYAYQIFLLLKKLNIDEVCLVGHSFGGRVSIILSSMFDINIKGMVLTASAGLNRFSLIKTIKIYKYKLCKKLHSRGLLKNWKSDSHGSSDYIKLDDNMKKVFVKVVNQDLHYLLKRIKTNLYLMWDKNDDATPYWICRKIQSCIKVNETIITKNYGHFTAFYNINKFIYLCNKCMSN